jgi:glycosyltransferase involved in cell wall biosynthesis
VIVQPPDITKLVREFKIDIYHISRAGDYEPGTLPEKVNGRPRIVETNIFHAVDNQEGGRIDCYLFPSVWSKNTYIQRHGTRPQARYEALYLPVDFEEFPPYTKEFTATFGRCSRADDQKWHDVCVDSLPKILRKVPEARCLYQGATDRVKARLAGLGLMGRVELTPTSVRLSDFYRQLDVFTHGARIGEGYGVVIAEAMANRLPVVTIATPRRKKSNAQGEVVDHKVTGFVCRWRWQYAGAVIELLRNHDLRKKFAQRSYEKAREEFEASKLTRKLEHIYTDAMDAPR